MRIKMRKKIVSLFLVIVMCLGLFTGCTLFKYDNERDYKQVVATVSSVTITDDSSEENRNNPFVTKEKKIYKYELVSMLNSNGQNLISSGKSLEDAVDYLVDNLVTRLFSTKPTRRFTSATSSGVRTRIIRCSRASIPRLTISSLR